MAHLFYSELTKTNNKMNKNTLDRIFIITFQFNDVDDNRNRSRDFRKHNVNIFKNFT